MVKLGFIITLLIGHSAFARSFPPLKCSDVMGKYKLYRAGGPVTMSAISFECVSDASGEQLKICKHTPFSNEPKCSFFPINYTSEGDRWQPVNAPRKAQSENGSFWSIFYPQYPWYNPTFDTWSDTAGGGSILTYNLDAVPATKIKMIQADLQDRRKDDWVETVFVKE